MLKVIKIDGMSCGHCEMRVKTALNELGVEIIKVSAAEDLAEVKVENITDDQLTDAIEDAGYDVLEIK